jgi:hypothetical protein
MRAKSCGFNDLTVCPIFIFSGCGSAPCWTASGSRNRQGSGGRDHEKAGWLGFVVSHPFREVREKDGARGIPNGCLQSNCRVGGHSTAIKQIPHCAVMLSEAKHLRLFFVMSGLAVIRSNQTQTNCHAERSEASASAFPNFRIGGDSPPRPRFLRWAVSHRHLFDICGV